MSENNEGTTITLDGHAYIIETRYDEAHGLWDVRGKRQGGKAWDVMVGHPCLKDAQALVYAALRKKQAAVARGEAI